MCKLGIILKQEVLSIENERQDYSTSAGINKSEILSKVMMKFTWIDCETGEKDENLFGANGQNGWEKGLGSALTYGGRYFLLTFFHIPTDQDDVDAKAIEECAPAKPELKIDSKEWETLIKHIESGKSFKLKSIQDKYVISDETKKQLESLNIF